MWEWVASILAMIATAAVFLIGLIVWFGERKNSLRIPFLWLTIFVAAWIASNVLFVTAPLRYQFVIALISYATALLVAVQTFYFTQRLVKRNPGKLTWVYVALGYCAALLSALPGVVGKGVDEGTIITRPAGILVYGALVSLYLISACVWLFAKLPAANRILKRQIKLLLAGIAVSSVIGLFFNLLLPIIGNYNFIQLGPAGAVAFVIAVAYAVARYSLFDVRLAIVRGVAYLATFATLAGVYFVVAFIIAGLLNSPLLSSDQIALNILTALLMALLLQPIKKFFDKLTSKVFYRDNYDTDLFFAQINQSLSSSTDLRGILHQTTQAIAENLKAEQVSFFVYTVAPKHLTTGTSGHMQVAAQDVRELNEFVMGREDPEELIQAEALGKDDVVKRLMLGYRLEVIVPLIQKDKVVGYMFLGERRSGGYTRRDMRLLSTIVDELLIAIQNALAVKEVRDLNAGLEQRINTATSELRRSNAQLQKLDEAKDEFISMASHQLRTPLTSIKGYISMLLEGDVGKVTGEQKHLLDEAFISSERMVRLIGDFLNVSRLQTGKFVIEKAPVDLAKVVSQEIDSLLPNAASRGLKFTYKPPKGLPMLNLDDAKIRQVIMNFADNAIYYSKEKTAIKVELKQEGRDIVFTVKDTGIGVPENEKEHLFTKFFRATNARKQRPDGTGVGLFLAKKVVDAHDGKIVFESKVGKGSTFGFSLPLAASRVASDTKQLDDKPGNKGDDPDSN